MANENNTLPNLLKDEQELWARAVKDLNSYCATFSAPTIIYLLNKLSKECSK
jgi:hypothetical protein